MLYILVYMMIILDRTESTFMHLCVELYAGTVSLKSVLNNK